MSEGMRIVVMFMTAFVFVSLFIQTIENLIIEGTLTRERRQFQLWLHRGILLLLFFLFYDTPIVALSILILRIASLRKWQGLFSGGSDVMTNLTLLALIFQSDILFLLLVVHILVSYFISGAIKLKSASWRNGSDLQVFLKASVIIVPKFLRTGIGKAPKLISIAVAIFEVVLPFLFLNRISFGFALGAGIFFHLANFFLFGLNRFFWAWLAAYPSLLWLHRIIS